MPKLSVAELRRGLRHFTGTEQYHRTGLRSVSTDGAVYLAENAECYWLLTLVDSVMHFIREDFAVVDLTVSEDEAGRHGEVVIHNGHEKRSQAYKVFHRQVISHTDFPLDEIRLYVQDGVILLPSEY